MRTIQVMALCGSLVLPAMAEARQTTPRPLPGGPTTTPSGSYLNLTPRRMPQRAPLIQAARGPRPSAPAAERPRVVCGMTLIPGDASLDPGITARATPPAGRPSIRAVDPPVCGSGPAR